MTRATEWVTDEDRPAVEAAIQTRVQSNGHPPLSADALSLIVAQAGRMVVAWRGTVTGHALTIVNALYPPPSVEKLKARSDALFSSIIRDGTRKRDTTPAPAPYRPEPPNLKGRRRWTPNS
jgi:hypothetical protein